MAMGRITSSRLWSGPADPFPPKVPTTRARWSRCADVPAPSRARYSRESYGMEITVSIGSNWRKRMLSSDHAELSGGAGRAKSRPNCRPYDCQEYEELDGRSWQVGRRAALLYSSLPRTGRPCSRSRRSAIALQWRIGRPVRRPSDQPMAIRRTNGGAKREMSIWFQGPHSRGLFSWAPRPLERPMRALSDCAPRSRTPSALAPMLGRRLRLDRPAGARAGLEAP